MKVMKSILAIDPGPTESAICLWDGKRVNSEWAMQIDNDELLQWFRKSAALDCTVAVEMIASYGMAVGQTTFETCVFIGRLQEVCTVNQYQFIRIFRKDVKLHLCGRPQAKDTNIRQALIDKLGEVGTKKNPGPLYGVSKHIWSALAVAVTCQETKLKNL